MGDIGNDYLWVKECHHLTSPLQLGKIVEAVHLGIISEPEAKELLLAIMHGDQEAIKHLMESHGKADK